MAIVPSICLFLLGASVPMTSKCTDPVMYVRRIPHGLTNYSTFCQISFFRKNSNLPRLEPEADMKQNGTWKKLETEANQVNLKARPVEV